MPPVGIPDDEVELDDELELPLDELELLEDPPPPAPPQPNMSDEQISNVAGPIKRDAIDMSALSLRIHLKKVRVLEKCVLVAQVSAS